MLWEKLDGWFDKAAGFTRVALVFLGFALIRRWLSLVTFLVPAHVAATLPLSMSTLFALVQCATSVAVVVASHRLAPLHRRGPFLGGSVALLSGGTLLAAFSGSFFQPALACMAGVGLAAAGYSVLFVLWLEASMRASIPRRPPSPTQVRSWRAAPSGGCCSAWTSRCSSPFRGCCRWFRC